MTRKKIFLFGATGSTGIYLTDYILNHIDQEKYELIAVGRRQTSYFERYQIKYYSIDITNNDELDQLPVSDAYAVIILSGILPARMKRSEERRVGKECRSRWSPYH